MSTLLGLVLLMAVSPKRVLLNGSVAGLVAWRVEAVEVTGMRPTLLRVAVCWVTRRGDILQGGGGGDEGREVEA